MTDHTASLLTDTDWSAPVAKLPVERFTSEMLKALEAGAPHRFFELMVRFGLGGEFLPELFQMPLIPAGPPAHHPEGDLLTHSIQVLRHVASRSPDPRARFCALFHDLGKLETDPACYPRHHGHEEAGVARAARLSNRLRLPKSYRRALAGISRLHGKANRWEELRDSTRLEMAVEAVRAGITELLPLVVAGDKPGAMLVHEWERAVGVAGMSTRGLGIAPEALAAVEEGRRAQFIMQQRIRLLGDGG